MEMVAEKVKFKSTGKEFKAVAWALIVGVLGMWSTLRSRAYEFTLSGVTLDLQEITTNTAVYFTSMRFNRAANEWDVEVTVSNRTAEAISGPLVLLVDRFSGTTGPLRTDGVSSNQFFFDLSAQLGGGFLDAGAKTTARTLALGFISGATPTIVPRVFSGAKSISSAALAFTRTLNQVGQPLPGVTIDESGPDGTSSNMTDSAFGVVTLGGSPGDYVWKFGLNGYLPVWRHATLNSNVVSSIPYPRLTPRSGLAVPLSPLLGGSVSNGTVQVQFGSGSLSQNTSARLTLLDGQTLPAFLPQGWSPLQAFWLELSSEPGQSPQSTLTPWGAINSDESAALVKLDPATLNWQVLTLVPGNGTNALHVSLPGSGAYALVVADGPPLSPPPANAGSVLQPGNASPPNFANLRANGTVRPGMSPASLIPELVTATADVVVSNSAGPLSSGTLLSGEVSQRYILNDGTYLTPPIFDGLFVGYQRPAVAQPGALDSRFPLQPLLLFGPETLKEGVVHVELSAPDAFAGGLLGTNGGLIADSSVRLLAPPGTVSSPQAVHLRALSVTNFNSLAGANVNPIAAFEVAVGSLAEGKQLGLQISGIPTNSVFVLARSLMQNGVFGLEPRQRLQTDDQGLLSSTEPPGGAGLPGLAGSGDYVLLQVAPQQGLVSGVARNSSGQASGGLPVRVAGQPWLTFSASDGSFKLLAPAGNANLAASDLATGDTGAQSVNVPADLSPVATVVSAVPAGLQVASITPTNGAVGVPQVSSVSITFNRPVNPGSLLTNAIRFLGNSNQPVDFSFNLDLANTTASILPLGSLDPGTRFTVLLSSNITDTLGRTLVGSNQFVFSTVALSARDPAAQLIIYEPGATNVPATVLTNIPGYLPGTNKASVVVQGTGGAADPGVPVIVVNENSGETTTVLSKKDGSFAALLSGSEQDFVSATFVSLNGARVYVPVNRQLFDNGFVGLYRQGGTLAAQSENGPIQVVIPANGVETRTKFKLSSLNTNDLQAEVGGVNPSGATVAGGALRMQIDGPAPTLPMRFSFPVDLAQLGFPTNEVPTNAAAVATVVQDTQDVKTYQVVDQLLFRPTPRGFVPKGHRPKDEQLFYGVLESVLGFSGAGFVAQTALNFVVVPLLIGPRAVVIKGNAESIPSELSQAIDAGQLPAGFVPGGNASLDYLKRRVGTPLSGAFIILRQLANPDIGQPGRLQPGMVYATSGSDGSYLMVAPSLLDIYILTATHPQFDDKQTEPIYGPAQLSLAGVIFKDFFFEKPAVILAPPNLNIANAPQWPAPGQDCLVEVNASHALGAPRISVGIQAVNSLVGGVQVTKDDATLQNQNVVNTGKTAQWTGTVHSDKSVQVILKVSVQAANGFGTFTSYAVDFSGFTLPSTNQPIPRPDTNDVHGPLVVSTDPPNNGFLGTDDQISIFFNKPIDSYVNEHPEGIILGDSATPVTPIVRLSPGQALLQIQFPGLPAGQTFRLTLSGQSIRDLAGKPLDQRPSTTEADSFSMVFRTPPVSTATLAGLANGKGAAISGTHLYVLDQAPQDNYLTVYDVSVPSSPILLSRTHLFGAPRDLTVIPSFSYKVNEAAPVVTNELVAVVGGDLDSVIGSDSSVTTRGQYLWVLNMQDPASPQILASPIVTYRIGSAVTKVRWAPPYLVYQEFGADIQQLGFVNLQELIIGYGSTSQQQVAFPADGQRGRDQNGDGDYVDPGETLPLPPAHPIEFYGKEFGYVLQNTTQKILDYSVIRGGDIVGITVRNGSKLDAHGNPVASLNPAYRTLAYNGFTLDLADPQNGAVFFGSDAYPRWVSIFDSLVVLSNGVPTIPVLALVSLTPDQDQIQKLAVIDITLPLQPRLLNKVPIPTDVLGGAMQSVSRGADGLLQLAGPQNTVLLNPLQLGVTNWPAAQLHPAIAGVIPSAGGTTRTVASTDFGLYAVADGGRGVTVQTPPSMSFVNFPDRALVVDPKVLHQQDESSLADLMLGVRTASAIPPAHVRTNLDVASDLDPPQPAAHFHVLVKAPGSSGPSIELGLESLNHAGHPLANLGNGFPPVRAVTVDTQSKLDQMPRACGAEINPLTAYRMSDDPRSSFYNRYLSRPFALVCNERVSAQELSQLKQKLDREIIWSGAQLRAFIDPSQSGNLGVGRFAAQIDPERKILYPLAGITAFTLAQPYVMGPNPPPSGTAATVPGTFGAVSAHSAELRTDAIDLSLPSPHMPIQIQRFIGNQDSYEGPFGVGWDFNYNERVTVLDPQTFPVGLQMPVIVRDNKDDSEVAGSQDILWHSGHGRTVLFRWVDTNMPPTYAADPLVQQFDYQNLVSDYYLPSDGEGVYDLLVKYKDGRFERLTPSGQRFRYAPQGRLEMIIDRFPNNHHDLQYDSNGWLVRIDDRSVPSDRYVQFGYYRRASDPDFDSSLDQVTASGALEGKICKLRDFAGRDVLYQYSGEALLTNRFGVQVEGENGGFAGRAQTHYSYIDCTLVGVSSGADGAPLFNAVTLPGGAGQPVAQSSTGVGGPVKIDIPLGNSAANLNGSQTTATQADGRSTKVTFDKYGHATSLTISGGNGTDSQLKPQQDQAGNLVFVQYPEGRTETRVFDTNNPVFRSRGNLVSVTVDPGPRGGVGYSQTYHFDPRYNQMSGAQKDANDFVHNYALTPDGREVLSITHGTAGAETFGYNDRGQLTSKTDFRGVQLSFGYLDANGFLNTSKNGENTTTYSYSSDTASLLGRPSGLAPPEGAPTSLRYNANLQEVSMQRGSHVVQRAYDERGRETYKREEFGDGKVAVTTEGYDPKGFLTNSQTAGVEVDGSETSLAYSYTPDSESRLKSALLPGGVVQTFDYDNRGDLVKMAFGPYIEEYERDREGNVLTVKQGGDAVQTIGYDGLDRPTTLTRKTGTQDEIEARTYFPGGQLKSVTVSDPQFGTSSARSTEQIDEIGRPVKMTWTGSTISPQLTYSYSSLQSSVTDLRQTTRRTWDNAGFQLSTSDAIMTSTYHPDGSGRILEVDQQEDGANYSEFFTYDGLDHVTSDRDDLGLRLTFNPRADGVNLTISNSRSNTSTFEYSVAGERLRERRANGVEFSFRHDPLRHLSYSGDPSAGFSFKYDDQLRLTQRTLRSGALVTYDSFDPRRLPTVVTIPGGKISMSYDLQKRLTSKTVTYQGTTYQSDISYDAMGRVRVQKYTQDGGAQNTATYDYDPAGVLLQARFQEAGQDLKVGYAYDPDTARNAVTYSSGVTVHQERDQGGRLRRVYDANGDIIRVNSWQGNEEAKDVTLGSSIHLVNQFDARGRLTASRYTRTSDGVVLAHMRYQYDAANNLEARQFLHRLGRTDNFSFDSGERLVTAQVGGIPLIASGSAAGLYDRNYNYHLSGLDYLTTANTTNYGVAAPAFASLWTAHDAFLQPTLVDGFTRGAADPMGNVQQAQLWTRPGGETDTLPFNATLVHNGDGRLTRIVRSDGLVEDNFFQPGGLRYLRRLTLNGQTLENRSYVYDDKGRLLEEFEPSNSVPQVVCRYFYASDDAPVAADLPDPTSQQLKRYFFLRDGAGSPVCVADASGNVLERVSYDPFGQPVIEGQDSRPPVLKQVVSGTNGSLLAVLSEPVWSPTNDPGPGAGIVRFPAPSVQGSLTVSLNSTNLSGTTELLASFPGYEPYSVLQFTPSQPLPTTPSSLTAWWPGDVSALDVAGGHNGALRGGVTNGPGLINQAFRFNGVNGFVEIPDDPALNPGANDFTASLWVYFTDTTAQQVLIEKWVQSSRAGWSFLKTSDNRLRLSLGDGAGNEQDIDSATLALPLTNWVHLAVRRQGSTFGVFTNGIAVATATHTAGLTSSTTLKFGAREGASSFLKGAIDEVTLYNRALTDAELTAVAAGVSAPGPVTVTLASGVLSDEWGNLNAGARLSFLANNQSQPGTVYYSAEPEPRTAPVRLARSALGSAILFHGQYFDYDSGLIYLRARFYDPFSGMFFEPDPAGYEDSVNLYAGLANNPVSNRDPTGLGVQSWEWEYISSGFGLAPPQRKVQVFTAEQEARRALKRRNTSWNFLEVETSEAGRAKVEERFGRAYPLWQAEMELETYTGHRRVMLGLDPFVQATEQHWGGNQFMSLSVAFADEQVDRAIEQTANRQLRAGLRPRLIINVEGWVGGSLEEKVNAAITRGARAYPDEAAGFRLAHAPEFKMEPHLEIPVKAGADPKVFSVTDKEMYRAYRAGALEHAIFVSGKEGENIVRGQSKLRSLFRSIRE